LETLICGQAVLNFFKIFKSKLT